MNTTVWKVSPRVVEVLGDRQWHTLSELVSSAGDSIMPELACRFYEGTGGGSKTKGANKSIDERVRYGRFRGVYQAVESLVRKGLVEKNQNTEAPRDRLGRLKNAGDGEYRLIDIKE